MSLRTPHSRPEGRWRQCLLSAGLALILVTQASNAYADEGIASEQRPTAVSAYGGWLAWSSFDPASGEYRLMARGAGGPSVVPVASRQAPFDVDLGPDAEGNVVAVYSRCADTFDFPINQYARRPSEGCDLFKYDFATGTERKLDGASTNQASEYLPTIWRDEIAFARIYEQREGKRGIYPYLYVRQLADRGATSRRQPGGARGLTGRPGPTGLDLANRHLAFSWGRRLDDGESYRSALRLVDIPAGERQVLSRVTASPNRFLEMMSPSISDGQVFYAGPNAPGSPQNYFAATGIDEGGETRYAEAPSFLTSVAIDDERDGYFYARARGLDGEEHDRHLSCANQSLSEVGCQVGRIEPINYRLSVSP